MTSRLHRAQIEICGVTQIKDVDFLCARKIEYIVLVLVESSKRQVSPEQAKKLANQVSGQTEMVAVFMDQPLDCLIEVMAYTGIHLAQLHESETTEYVDSLPYPTIKRVHPTDLLTLSSNGIDAKKSLQWLIDPGAGNDQTFDWQQYMNDQNKKKKRDLSHCWLAGCLTPDNVRTHLDKQKPKLVDVLSGVEDPTPGHKDWNKINQFIDNVGGKTNA